MGTARCDWHVADFMASLDDDADPMQEIGGLESGAAIVLSKTEAELAGDLRNLVERENRLHARMTDEEGKPLTCELKTGENHVLMSSEGTLSCFNCPLYAPPESEAKRRYLCTLGREQHGVVEHLRGLQLARSAEAELAVAREGEIDGCAELAEMAMA